MKKLKVNFDEIQKAMEDVARDSFEYFLDLKTGEVVVISEDILNKVKSKLYEGDYDEIGDNIEYIEFDEEPDLPYWMEDEVELAMEILLDEKGRYVCIPPRKSSEAFKVMVGFIEEVTDPILKKALTDALNGKGAFRNFKNVLLNYPKERKKWHSYNAKEMKNVIIKWLESIGIEASSK